MDVRSVMTRWAGAGATRNARASLDEWNRAQDEVAALLMRLDHPDRGQTPATRSPQTVRAPGDPRPGTAA